MPRKSELGDAGDLEQAVHGRPQLVRAIDDHVAGLGLGVEVGGHLDGLGPGLRVLPLRGEQAGGAGHCQHRRSHVARAERGHAQRAEHDEQREDDGYVPVVEGGARQDARHDGHGQRANHQEGHEPGPRLRP